MIKINSNGRLASQLLRNFKKLVLIISGIASYRTSLTCLLLFCIEGFCPMFLFSDINEFLLSILKKFILRC